MGSKELTEEQGSTDMRLLIVDDEDIIRRGLQMIDWNSIGVTDVVVANDGTQARDLLQQSKIDVVVSDIRMPELNGLELANYVSTHARHTKIVLLTGFSDFEYAQQAIRLGVTDYLLKPIKPMELLQVVQRAYQSLQLDIMTDCIVQEYQVDSDTLVIQQQILKGFQKLGGTVSSILFYLAEHYMENLTLAILSDKFHFSTIHICRMIKKETGYSFHDILTGIRFSNAAKMLWETDLKVNQICEKVGIIDQRYFSKVFKKIFECSPMEYRKRNEKPKNYTLLELLDEMI